MNILVINCGSSTVKYQLFNTTNEKCLLKNTIELNQRIDIHQALENITHQCREYELQAIGHRVAHGADIRHAQIIDDSLTQHIENCIPLAPLHNPYNLVGIKTAQQLWPKLPQVAVFDTAFHSSLPRRAYTYAIPQDIAEQYKIRRYGFHGTSHHYVAKRTADFLQQDLHSLRIISLHLGNGASACAIEFGHSTETSMGMTPLEGLVMGTRTGDIDAGILFTLAMQSGMGIDKLNELFNQQSGLKGISGISHDMRILEDEAAKGSDKARLAINIFVHRIRKYIGAYAAIMGGVDAIILTGGIGENSASIRQRLLQRLDFLGLVLNDDSNLDANVNGDYDVAAIHANHSRVKVLVVKTNEELKIARQTASIVQKRHHVKRSLNIPIAVSARHAHLTKDTFTQLFGETAQLTHYKDLVQPGQFASNETVTLIGPKGKIERVRILGPLRSYNQVEISRTDEFLLGVDAPVRDSGQVRGSAPIILEGPKGRVSLSEGLICAHRHIHMTPEDADNFCVKDGDKVEVAIAGKVRSLTFGDVLIRVHPSYALEMHIDTDEANAAELSADSDASLVYHEAAGASASLRINTTDIK